jgi:alpha-1,4-digalacturonate transport system permease protein
MIKKSPKKKTDKTQKWAVLFCAPNILLFIIFFLVPAIIGIYYSFTNYNGINRLDFVGLKNYTRLFQDKEYYLVLLNTLKFTLFNVPVGYVVALGLAILLSDDKIKGNFLTRVLVYWPTLLSSIMVGVTWKWLFSESFGFVNYVLISIGAAPVKWFANPTPAFITTVIASAWSGCGVNMLIFIGGIKQISGELYEAARIDGAGKWQQFRVITFPALKPLSYMVILLSIINSFKVFAMALTLTNGGPGTATTYMIQYIYQTGFERMDVGFSSAVSMTMFILLMVISYIQTKLNAKNEEE